MKRVTIIGGHYGSGKTNIAVNLAFKLKKSYNKVAVADIDIVNPYFRTSGSERELEAAGIQLILPQFAGSNIDLPALPRTINAVTDDKSCRFIVDVGGDDRGALALGRLTNALKIENDYDFFLVINKFRPLTATPDGALEVMREIEAACRLKFTGIINNPNLGEETTAKDVLDSAGYAGEVSRLTGLPIVYTAADERIMYNVQCTMYNAKESLRGLGELLPLKLQPKPF